MALPPTSYVQFSSVQSLSRVQLFAISWTEARQASLPIANSRSLLKLKSVESVMPSNSLILYHPSPPYVLISYLLNIYRITDVENKYLDPNGERKWCKELGD